MGEGAKHRFHGNPTMAPHDEDSDGLFESDGFSSDSEDDNSAKDANTSPTPSPPSNSCSGPLYELSSLMQQLPVKKGLSKHYNGKSQSFTTLADAQCLEDLPKKENPSIRKIKPCKSYAILDGSQKPNHGQGDMAMPKKPPRVSSCASFISTSNYS